MTSSAQLERESEQTRSELARALGELRERMTPGQLVDQAVDYAKDTTGGEFFRNLRRQMAANPLPVVLIGAGIGWLALAKRNSGPANGPAAMGFKGAAEDVQARPGTAALGAGERMSEWSSQAGEIAAEAGQQASDMAGSLGESTKDAAAAARSQLADAASTTSERAASAYESIKSGASGAATTAGNVAADGYGRVADTAGRAGSAMAQSARGLGQKASGLGADALKYQPLLLAGLGLALGSVLGALFPPTDAEDRLMGGTSDRVKEQARATAEDQIDKVKKAVETGMEQAQTQAEGAGESVPASFGPQIDEDKTVKPTLD